MAVPLLRFDTGGEHFDGAARRVAVANALIVLESPVRRSRLRRSSGEKNRAEQSVHAVPGESFV